MFPRLRGIGAEDQEARAEYSVDGILHLVLEIVSHQLKVDYAEIAAKCTGKEAMLLAVPMNELLQVSGFGAPGEAEATMESPGTGTSTSSSPNLPPTESSVETSTQ